MKKSILLFLFLVSCSSYQKEDSLVMVQLTDRNGLSETISSEERLSHLKKLNFDTPQPYQKVLRVYKKHSTSENLSLLTSYHPNGQIFQYLEILNARAYGFYREWYENGQKKLEAIVIGGPADLSLSAQKEWLFDQSSHVWDEKGNLVSEIPYEKGSLQGNSLYFYSSGKLKKLIPYHNNQIHGDLIEYRENQEILSKTTFHLGKKQGVAMDYWPNGKIRSIEEYENDLLLKAEYLDEDNHILSQIDQGNGQKTLFKNDFLLESIYYNKGKPDGLIKRFAPDKQLIATYFLKNGEKEKEETLYFLKEELSIAPKEEKEPQPKLSLYWNGGLINGTIKTWYDNGQLESQRQMVQNKKNGTSCAWYRDGSLMLLEEYEDDLLLKGSYFKMGDKAPVSTIVKGNGTASLFDGKGFYLRKVSYIKGKPQE